MPAVVEYIREDGANPFRRWFDGLDSQAAAKVTTAILRLRMGHTSNLRRIGAIAEYRVDWGPGYRIYPDEDGSDLVILLGGGSKRRQRADIERAAGLFAEYRTRKRTVAKPGGNRWVRWG
jgi:putative addiction module killer protein